MRLSIYGIICLVCFGISSCGGEEPEGTLGTDTTSVDTTGLDTTGLDSNYIDTAGYVDDDAMMTDAIEEKYGEQWEFCDCVVKNDSVNKAIDEAETDEDFDRVLARMEVIDQHCKEMLTTPNTTPDERAAHERKVTKCLKNAK